MELETVCSRSLNSPVSTPTPKLAGNAKGVARETTRRLSKSTSDFEEIRSWLLAMCSHASPVGRELSAFPGGVTKFRSLSIALLHRCRSRPAGDLGRVHVELPRGLPGLVMSGRGERRCRHHRSQGDGSKKFLHLTSPVDRYRPQFGGEAFRSFMRRAASGEMRTPMTFDYELEKKQTVRA